MERESVKKFTTLSFLGAALVTYVIVNVLFKSMAGAFGIVQRWYSVELINHGLPIVAAVLAFSVLQFNSRVVTWAEDVVLEVSKVVWPSRRDTVAMTIVVCVFVGVASGILVVIDFLARNIVRMIIQ